jgi:hypothetical protein
VARYGTSLHRVIARGEGSLGTGPVVVEAYARLELDKTASADWTLTNTLVGAGTLRVEDGAGTYRLTERGGMVAPGTNTAGEGAAILTVDGAMAFGSGSSLGIDITGTNGVAGVDFDRLLVDHGDATLAASLTNCALVVRMMPTVADLNAMTVTVVQATGADFSAHTFQSVSGLGVGGSVVYGNGWIGLTWDEAKPEVTLTATRPWAYESATAPTAGVFTVSRGDWTNGATVVAYTLGGEFGAATPGPAGDYTTDLAADYAAGTGAVVIADGQTNATVTVWPVDDAVSEYPETVTLTLGSSEYYTIGSPAAATVTIRDDETEALPLLVSAGVDQTVVGNAFPVMAALDGTVLDDGRGGTVTQLWTAVSGPGAVTVGDATVADTTAGFGTAGDYVLQLQAGDGAFEVSDTVTVAVVLNAITVQATDPVGRLNLTDTATFMVYRPAAAANTNLVVNYALGGTATNGVHYTIAPASGQVIMPAGQTNGAITVTPLGVVAPEQTVELTLLPGSYALGAPSMATCTLLERKAGVVGLQAVHRDGQTFLTWTEPDSPVQESSLVYSNYFALQAAWGPVRRYRIYRSSSPITNVAGVTRVGETGPLSCWNNRSTETWTLSGPTGMVRYVVAEGQPPLPPATGLYVHNPQGVGALSGYYAVTPVTNGVENTQLHAGNTLAAPVAEQQGQGTPVLQSFRTGIEFAAIANARVEHYVRWEAPPTANGENRPNDIVVAIPPNVTYPAPLGMNLHDSNSADSSPWSGYGWWFNGAIGAILVASDGIPLDWWTGYHESYGKIAAGPAWTNGVVRPYTQRRLLSLTDWAMTRWAIASNRVFSAGGIQMGGSGSIMLGIRHPERVAWSVSWAGVHVPSNSQAAASYKAFYGEQAWNVKFEDGTPVWQYFDDVWYLRQYPERETPFIAWSSGSGVSASGSPDMDFYRAMQETKRPHTFEWGVDRFLNPRPHFPLNHSSSVNPIDMRIDQSLPAFTRCSLDDDPANADPAGESYQQGTVNYWLYWQTTNIVDEAGEWAMTVALTADCPSNSCTVDLTPRRLQRFKVNPGDPVDWTSTSGGVEVQSGTVVADSHRLLTIENLIVHKAGTRVRMVPGGAPPGSLTVSSVAGAHGRVLPSGAVYVAPGGSTGFVIRADAHYHIGSILTNGGHVPGSPFADNAFTNTTWVWSNIQTNGMLSASFDENLWSAYGVPETWLAPYYPATSDYANAAIADTDRDGHAAWQERVAGTDPTVTTSVLAVTRADWQSGAGYVLRWSSVSNRWYRVAVASNLQAGFAPLSGLLPATPPLNVYTDQTAVGMGMRFYEVSPYTNAP